MRVEWGDGVGGLACGGRARAALKVALHLPNSEMARFTLRVGVRKLVASGLPHPHSPCPSLRSCGTGECVCVSVS